MFMKATQPAFMSEAAQASVHRITASENDLILSPYSTSYLKA